MLDKGTKNRNKSRLFESMVLLLPVLVGCCCMGLWWLEQDLRLGWSGTAWLQQGWWSIYPIIGLIVVMFLGPLWRMWSIPWYWLVFYVLVLSLVSWGGYTWTRSIFYTLYADGLIGGDRSVVTVSFWKLFGIVLLVACVYFVPLRQFHQSTDRLHLLTLVEAFILVIPCSLISLELFSFIGTGTTFLDAVHWGYPFFWIPFFLGYLSIATAKEWM